MGYFYNPGLIPKTQQAAMTSVVVACFLFVSILDCRKIDAANSEQCKLQLCLLSKETRSGLAKSYPSINQHFICPLIFVLY